MTTEHNSIADAARVAEASMCHRWAAQQAALAGQPAAAALFRSIADAKIGHAFALIAEFRDPPELALSLRLSIAAELAEADRLEQHAASTSAKGLGATAKIYMRIAAACRAQAGRLAELTL
jgi:rubrerythrin